MDVPGKNGLDVPRKTFLALSPVGAVIGIPVGVVCFHHTSVYCAYLCCARCLVGKELVILLRVCCRKMICYVLCIFFPTWCLCWDSKFNCIDFWPFYSYFMLATYSAHNASPAFCYMHNCKVIIFKCYEPLQKLRVRLGTCKTGLSPPVTLCY